MVNITLAPMTTNRQAWAFFLRTPSEEVERNEADERFGSV
jgi:hypothetical protein